MEEYISSTNGDFGLGVVVYPTPYGDGVDHALKRLRKRVDKAGLMDELYRRQYYLKPCLAKRVKKKKSQWD